MKAPSRIIESPVAMFIDSLDPGGAESMILELSKELILRGVHVKLLHFGNKWLSANAKDIGIPIEQLRFYPAFRSKWLLPLFCLYFASRLRRDRIGVLHAHLTGAVFAGAITGWLARLPVVGTLHDAYSIRENPKSRSMLKLCQLTNSRIVAVSKDIADLALESTAQAICIRTIYNGVKVSHSQRNKPHKVSQSVATGQDIVRLVVVARLVPVKRIDRLLRVLATVDSKVEWNLDILGDGPLKNELERQSRLLGIDSRVTFLGFVNQVTARLRKYDVFLISSDSEGLSMSLLEAMAAGLCCVATNVGGNPELIGHAKTGILVPKSDETKFAQELSKIIDSPSMRHSLGEAAHQRVANEFRLEMMTDRYQQLYSEVSGK